MAAAWWRNNKTRAVHNVGFHATRPCYSYSLSPSPEFSFPFCCPIHHGLARGDMILLGYPPIIPRFFFPPLPQARPGNDIGARFNLPDAVWFVIPGPWGVQVPCVWLCGKGIKYISARLLQGLCFGDGRKNWWSRFLILEFTDERLYNRNS
ncbi:hypothetical protein AVEN_128364-1 [Araneus ventricosus]|uniref:Uncharacterized protein n=1 Tax=Araneus ventricosus TaxID=182803 RepID=A0A4Y2DBZ5_ARAVE|nr:hypothetical protein AVEN_128364-1 [Araneus ventricosus]